MSLSILFVCGRNQWRSTTAERVFKNDARVVARSAGTSAKSKRQVRSSDLQWADLILVMERKYAAWIRDTIRGEHIPAIDSLDISDEYPYMDEGLIELIEISVETHLTQ